MEIPKEKVIELLRQAIEDINNGARITNGSFKVEVSEVLMNYGLEEVVISISYYRKIK